MFHGSFFNHTLLVLQEPASSLATCSCLQYLLNVLLAILESGLLVVQSLFQFSDVLLQGVRFGSELLVDFQYGYCNEHLAHTLVDVGLPGQLAQFIGCELVETSITSFDVDLGLSLADFLL